MVAWAKVATRRRETKNKGQKQARLSQPETQPVPLHSLRQNGQHNIWSQFVYFLAFFSRMKGSLSWNVLLAGVQVLGSRK